MREAKLLKAPRVKTVRLPFEYNTDADIIAANFDHEAGHLDPAPQMRTSNHSTSGGALGLSGLGY